jgi:hypothetical protein
MVGELAQGAEGADEVRHFFSRFGYFLSRDDPVSNQGRRYVEMNEVDGWIVDGDEMGLL